MAGKRLTAEEIIQNLRTVEIKLAEPVDELEIWRSRSVSRIAVFPYAGRRQGD
jgi:hypothetical protein